MGCLERKADPMTNEELVAKTEKMQSDAFKKMRTVSYTDFKTAGYKSKGEMLEGILQRECKKIDDFMTANLIDE